MTVSNAVPDVRACTHIGDDAPEASASTENSITRPQLRLVPRPTHIPDDIPDAEKDHPASPQTETDDGGIEAHPVYLLPLPSAIEAASRIWPARDEVTHGRSEQLASAALGVVQVLGLLTCSALAQVFFASKTRTAWFLITLTLALAINGLATLA